MGTLAKKDIVQNVHDKLGFSKKDSAEMVECVFGLMQESLARGEKMKISGFGTFATKEKKAQTGRNPQTGEKIEIPAKRVLSFKPSQILKRILND
jgi:integration host factor subunit alpha